MFKNFSRCIAFTLFILGCSVGTASAYAILAHEAIVDACWNKQIKPMLRARFPNTPDTAFRIAHSYCYGGAMVADMGYLPGGSEYFSDLMHYVRSGDMVTNLIKESRDVNEYAFALGALSHYRADEFGHSRATNVTVPLLYKKLKNQYGSVVTYNDNPLSHSRIEFSFDVLQIARGNYNSQEYHDFIGFNVSNPVLERALLKTYGESIDELFSNFDGSVKTFRWGVKNLMPTLINKTWKSNKDSILARHPEMTARKFKYRMKAREFHQEFGTGEAKPGFWARTLSWLINGLPKIGPLKTLKYVDPGREGERNFIHSFDTILVVYSRDLTGIAEGAPLSLADINFDTGTVTAIGTYDLADQTYADLLISLQDHDFKSLTQDLKANILNFYKDPQNIPVSNKYPIKCEDVEAALKSLKVANPQN
ncbi:zinc dependent phospholipase C family protein [Mucilaginibacter ginkgonis]|uniref:Zinc dependent phospholipase C family protein n=1 Tax=Mucilaginibacter ginkgonis TaxID=2682091 RepID=A0A6I4I1Z5_9SPHI|nr:zinc dependent phospholipase C family protein [Mucilaginibacter ginkgonis]QQL50800.1 zinc dependent phospholipase C family protein [Mucilaginibacter ginkgonis]